MAWGVQNKVLEAMAAKRPVVLTTGAARGIDAEDRAHFLCTDTAEQMADEIIHLLCNPKRRETLGRAARKRVADRHCWDREMAKLERLLLSPAETARPPVSRSAKPELAIP